MPINVPIWARVLLAAGGALTMAFGPDNVSPLISQLFFYAGIAFILIGLVASIPGVVSWLGRYSFLQQMARPAIGYVSGLIAVGILLAIILSSPPVFVGYAAIIVGLITIGLAAGYGFRRRIRLADAVMHAYNKTQGTEVAAKAESRKDLEGFYAAEITKDGDVPVYGRRPSSEVFIALSDDEVQERMFEAGANELVNQFFDETDRYVDLEISRADAKRKIKELKKRRF